MYATTKTYFVYTRVKGRVNASGRYLEIRESIGRHGIIKFEDAKSRAKEILEDAAIGITPDDRKREKENFIKLEKSKDISLDDAFKEYLSYNNQLKDSTRKNYQTHIDVYLRDWKNRPIRDISESDVLDHYNFLKQKITVPPAPPYQRKSRKATAEQEPRPKKERVLTNGPGVANATMKILRAVVYYIQSTSKYKGIISENPVKLGKAWAKLKTRDNFIPADKLPAWFNAVNESEHASVKDALLLLLFTGIRSKSEAFSLKWSDIDWTSKIMSFYDTKNSTTLRLPMSNFIYDLLKTRKKNYTDESVYVFPSPKSKQGNLTDIRTELDKINIKAGTTISPHDLRRTFTTYANKLVHIPFVTIKALINHESDTRNTSDVTEGYIIVEMYQRREAMQMITDYILRTVAESNHKILPSISLSHEYIWTMKYSN